MTEYKSGFLERALIRRARAFWSRAANSAQNTDLSVLRRRRTQAISLRQKLDELIALPRIGSSSFPKPPGTDWSWRPQLWRGDLPIKGLSAVPSETKLGDEVTVFHDCSVSELTLRQLRNTRESDLAPFGLRMDVFRFEGSFLSLALDLPESGREGLLRSHLLRFEAMVEAEASIEIFARLNVRHGPNTEEIVRKLPLENDRVLVEQVTIRDVTFSRCPRAEL